MTIPSADAVLAFWFGEVGEPGHGKPRAAWFEKSDSFDAEIAQRFGALVETALRGGIDDWRNDRTDALRPLASIIVLDQFTRNIFRGTARMFDGDSKALATAQAMVAAGKDRELLPVQRQFCYLPFEHAEDRALQARSVDLFAQLLEFDETRDLHDWAVKHQVIVARFGRFPHRNDLLGRPSTEEERQFLTQPGSGF